MVAGHQGAQGTTKATEDEIAFEGATVVTPANATLVRDLTLRVPSGTNLLVTGPNGSGKSSLFRVLGGLWPLTEGQMCKPGGQDGGDGLSHDIFYVPQRPYVTIGTLPDQLIYPLVQQGRCPSTLPLSPSAWLHHLHAVHLFRRLLFSSAPQAPGSQPGTDSHQQT